MESIRGVIGFGKTVAAGSFAGAAKALGVTPVALSKNVQRLERQLGVRVLHYPNRRNLPARVRTFVEFLLDQLRKNPDLAADAQTLLAPFLPREQSVFVGRAQRARRFPP